MLDFREVLSHCDLQDIGFSGTPWTYNNNSDGRANVHVRFDRGVANYDWSNVYPNAHISHLCSPRSDHMVLLLRLQGKRDRSTSSKTFCYEVMWERAEGLNAVVETSWAGRDKGDHLGVTVQNLKKMVEDLKAWSGQFRTSYKEN
jgi:hypothetical protein